MNSLAKVLKINVAQGITRTTLMIYYYYYAQHKEELW